MQEVEVDVRLKVVVNVIDEDDISDLINDYFGTGIESDDIEVTSCEFTIR